MQKELELAAVIGFKGTVVQGLILHPDNEHLIFPLGCTIVVRNLIQRTQTFLQGHDNQVSCVCASPSGQLLASGQKTFMGFPADVIIWDFHGRQELHRLSLHKVAVASLSFSFDEQYLASLGGQDDNSLVIWDVKSGSPICGTPAATDTAQTVKFFNGSNTQLITAGNYHIRVWDFDLPNKKVRPKNVNTGQLKRVCTNVLLSQDDAFAYVGSQTGDISVICMKEALFKRSAPKKCFQLGVTCSAMLPNGDVLVGTGSGTIAKLQEGSLRIKSQCQVLGGVTSIALTSDGSHFFAGTTQSNMYWVDSESLTAELRNTCHHERINHIAFPAGYSEVFATSSLKDIRVWNAKTRQELLRIEVPNLECHCIGFMRDGHSIISGWSDGKLRAFMPQSGRLKYVINDAHQNGVTSLATTSDCSRIVSGGMEGEVRVWKIGSQMQQMEASMKEHRGQVFAIILRQDDSQAVSASSDGSCIVWDLSTKTRSMCVFESTMFKGICYHPDESQLLTTGSDRKIAYWDTFDGQAIRVLEGSDEGELCCLAISESGQTFCSGGQDRLLKVWDYEGGTCKYLGIGHSGGITAVAIAPDQKSVVSVGSEGAIFIWNFPDEAEM
jgi:WD40 repeat protein